MANWNNYIQIEVKLPKPVILLIEADAVWFSGHDLSSRVWKAYMQYGDCRLLVVGKVSFTPKYGDKTTTYKVRAFGTYDGINPSGICEYKTKVLKYE